MLAHGLFKGGVVFDACGGERYEIEPRLGQANAFARSFEQRCSEFLFERLYGFAEPLLGNVELAGGKRK